MAGGWAPDGAVQDQIDDSLADEVRRARSLLPRGEGSLACVECGEEIPVARRHALPGARTCVACQSERDRAPAFTAVNRRQPPRQQGQPAEVTLAVPSRRPR